MRSVSVVVAALVLSACGGGASSGPSPPASTAPAASESAAASAAPPEADEPEPAALLNAAVPVPPDGPWRDDVEREHWAEAWKKLEGLPGSVRARPEMRFLRARVAVGLGKDAEAIAGLAGLEGLLPALARPIARLRAEAQARVGPFDQAAAYWAAQRGTRDHLLAAKCYEKAKRLDDARHALDRVVASAKGAEAAEARAVRMRVADAQGAHEAALGDARWLVHSAPGTPHDLEAQAFLRRFDPSFEFSARERVARAEKLGEAGRHDGALVELDVVEAGKGVSAGELAHLRGAALFKARRYAEAVDAIRQAIAAGAPAAGDDEYLLARALSRADRDEEALAAYRALAKKYAKTGRADDALYAVGRLSFLLGRDADADAAYAEYLKRFPKGKNKNDARYERALAQLGAGKAKDARSAFAQLAAAAGDPAEAARLRELEAVAAAEAGDAKGAERLFRDVIKSHPLSWAASVSRSRLLAMGLTPPPPIEPPAAGPEPPPLVVQLPGPVELLRRLGLLGDAEEYLARNESALRLAHAPRGLEALCHAYGLLERGQRRLQVSYEGVRGDTFNRGPSQATRWAWECLYPSPFGAIIRDVTNRDRLPAELIYAIMRQESGFRPKVVSPVGAIGLLQIMPYTGRALAKMTGTPLDEGALERPAVNVDLGSRYMANLLGIWKGHIPLMVASYNAGPHAVSRWVQRWGSHPVDVWAARIPYAETRQYVVRVMGNLARYTYLTGGEAGVLPVPLAIDGSLRAPDDAF
ncbi:MAG TPA: transglycosylase SLT domain-containing protein [Polyangiaceae bacterium]|nr:transglycosylase SLT domain-containing protein [Polyangiaceae bacterium]